MVYVKLPQVFMRARMADAAVVDFPCPVSPQINTSPPLLRVGLYSTSLM